MLSTNSVPYTAVLAVASGDGGGGDGGDDSCVLYAAVLRTQYVLLASCRSYSLAGRVRVFTNINQRASTTKQHDDVGCVKSTRALP